MYLVQYCFYQDNGCAGEVQECAVSAHRTKESAVYWIRNHFCQTIEDSGYMSVSTSDADKILKEFSTNYEVTFNDEHHYSIFLLDFGQTLELDDKRALKNSKKVHIPVVE